MTLTQRDSWRCVAALTAAKPSHLHEHLARADRPQVLLDRLKSADKLDGLTTDVAKDATLDRACLHDRAWLLARSESPPSGVVPQG